MVSIRLISHLFETEKMTLWMKKNLEENAIFPRRYFYPSLSQLSFVNGNTPIADGIASRILCIPLYHELTKEEQDMVVRILLRAKKYGISK